MISFRQRWFNMRGVRAKADNRSPRELASCDLKAKHFIRFDKSRHSLDTAWLSPSRPGPLPDRPSEGLVRRCRLNCPHTSRFIGPRQSNPPHVFVTAQQREHPAAYDTYLSFVRDEQTGDGIAKSDNFSRGSNERIGCWLHFAEQGCLALLSTILIAAFVSWLLFCRWRGEQRIEFEKIEIEEARFEVDPNHAAPVELQLLPGIGPKLASRIVASRELHGNFESVDELQRVHGIGEQTIRRLAPFIAIRTSTARPSLP